MKWISEVSQSKCRKRKRERGKRERAGEENEGVHKKGQQWRKAGRREA